MRPSELAEACRRAQAGEDFELALGGVLQAYYLAPGIEARVPMLADEPPRFADKRYDALVGGITPSSQAEGVAIQGPLGYGAGNWIASFHSQ